VNNTTKIIISLVTVVIIAGVAVLVIGANQSSAPDQTNNSSEQTATLTINYSDDGFSPSIATVAAGKLVKISNQSKNTLSFASAVHPVHDDNSELNLGDIKPGDSKTFTPTKKGTWGFHDHYKAANTGKLTVE
jgi:plastocyanin